MEMLPNAILRDDPWTLLPDSEPIPKDTPFLIIPWHRFEEFPLHNLTPEIERGVLFPNHHHSELLKDSLHLFSLISLDFPSFNDGRAYSQARTLRDQLHFSLTLRACGNILPDQITFMRRCGFNSIIVDTNRFPHSLWKEALASFSAVYQKDTPSSPSQDLPLSILEKRKLRS